MKRAPPTDLPKDAPTIGGRYAVLEPQGSVAQGELHTLWDTRLRMWRTGLRCALKGRDAVQDTARAGEDIRHGSLLRTRDVVEDWVVLEATDAIPLEIHTAWRVQEAHDAVHGLARAVMMLRDAGYDPGAVHHRHVLTTDDHQLLLVPPAGHTMVDPDGAESARSLAMLLAGLVRGMPLETSYDDASGLPPTLAAAYARATGHRPVLAELVHALEAYDAYAEDATDAQLGQVAPAPSRSDLIADDTERPSYMADSTDSTEKPKDRRAQLDDVRARAYERAEAAAAKAAEAPSPAKSAGAAGALGGLIFVGGALLLLLVMVPSGLIGWGTTSVRSARSATQAANDALADTLSLEVGAHDELEALGIDPEPVHLAHVAGPIHEGQALAAAIESTQRSSLSERPESRVLEQRWERIEPVFMEAIHARASWKAASDSLAGGLAVQAGLAPEYEPIPSVEHLIVDPSG